jgi:hypothetical protein
MNSRVVAGTIGVITLALGLYGLVSPASVLDFVGFAPQNPTQPALAHGEARAVYGGLFTVLGAFTLWGAIDPPGKRAALLMAGLLWLGLFAGRMLGMSIDGNPGAMGWLGLVWELAFGTALVWSAVARLPTATNVEFQ